MFSIALNNIPKQLQNPRFRFTRCGGKGRDPKAPYDKAWEKNGYAFDNPELLKWIEEHESYGIINGIGNIITIDADCKLMYDYMENNFPETYTQKTGSKNHAHYFYICKNVPEGFKTQNLKKDGDKPLGELRVKGQTICAGSRYKNTKKFYEVAKGLPIIEIDFNLIIELLSQFIKKKKKKAFVGDYTRPETEDLLISDVINLNSLEHLGNGQFIGSHPFHGSKGGKNFSVTEDEKQFYCFRCNEGGGVLQLLAQKEGIINCGEELKGENFKKVLTIAKKDYGHRFEYNVDDSIRKSYIFNFLLGLY